MLRWLAPSLALATCLPGCVLAPIDLEGRACDELDRCADGYACDLATRTCVRGEPTDAGLDAGATDAWSHDAASDDDARMDAATRDAGWLDAGWDAPLDDAPRDSGARDAAPSDAGVVRIVEFDVDTLDLTTPEYVGVDLVQIEAIALSGRCVIRMPARDDAHPLTVTNRGGQVRCGELILSGGPHWRLTGRYAPPLGAEGLPGHADGFGSARDHYGFHVTHGVQIGPSSVVAHAEIEFVEIEQTERGSVAIGALTIGSAATAGLRYEDIDIHDVYVHDTLRGGMIGGTGTAATVDGLEFHRNRVARAGSACFERLVIGDGTSIHDNVFVGCRLAEPSAGSSEPAVELRAREGSIRFERNLVIGSRGVALRVQDVGDTEVPAVEFRLDAVDNDFAWIRGGWIAYDAEAGADGSALTVTDAYFGAAPMAASPSGIVHVVDGSPVLEVMRISWPPDLLPAPPAFSGMMATSAMSGMLGPAAESLVVDPRPFTLDADPSRLRLWDASVTYGVGTYVVAGGRVFEARSTPTVGVAPVEGPEWRLVGTPDDDVTGLPLPSGFLGP